MTEKNANGADDGEKGKEEKGQQISADAFRALQEEVERLRLHKDEILSEKKKLKEKARTIEEEAAKKSGDIEALEKSWREKYESKEAEASERISTYERMLEQKTVHAEASALASEIAVTGSASVLLPHIQSRLKMEVREGVPKTVILDKDGKPSALSLQELKEEFVNSPAFAPLISGSKATGAGSPGDKGGASNQFPSKPGEFTRAQKAAYISKHGYEGWEKLLRAK